jgi:hypothetical protein
VKAGLKAGNLVGDPKIGGYTVVPEGIVVEATVSVVIPPNKAGEVLAEAPPKDALKLVFDRPELLTEVSDIGSIPLGSLGDSQFSALVKKMGGLGQYSEEVLVALLEGRRKSEWDTDYELVEGLVDYIEKEASSYVTGAGWEWSDGWGMNLIIDIEGGIVMGTLETGVQWRGRKLNIKKDIERNGGPYVGLDPEIHGKQVLKGKASEHPIFDGIRWEDAGSNLRPSRLPKGTPGVNMVDMSNEWNLNVNLRGGLDRSVLEDLVRWMAGS